MTEFSKIKIPFALALLAVLFAISPIVNKYGSVAYTLFYLPITLNFIYVLICSLLGSSVYFYAIGLVGERPIFEFIKKLGHISYAIALVVPALFALLYPVSILVELLIKVYSTPLFGKYLEVILSVLSGAVASIAARFIAKSFSIKDKILKIAHLSDQENILLGRAKQLFGDEYFDLCVAESWKAIEIALNKSLVSLGVVRPPRATQSMLDLAQQKKILNNAQINELLSIRGLRNAVVHTERTVSREEAHHALRTSDKIIATLEKTTDKCYFCNKDFPVVLLETDDVITGASVCKNCAKKHPNWQDELIAMGQDP